ncbi:hypothetical protein A2801_04315 [Candidatus Woesebacteria bacterium RIFCSPHIGHO2_01_FULL_41_10]|uniref:Phosphoglycerate kinase n=1 Tax=Candidatus Woesebacteria bacterium RIFCSPHIGHO2_01_FULL_41_10 TaxID=1802500 RepID=A0A1F7YLR2_9BACT|nr:MAG: hypothetical protein A2801_04315 [Candidatus Woesebacteria bacterium RIFCSPHIGHO2_01_FULL_41_10]
MNLPTLDLLDVSEKRVLVRSDLDVVTSGGEVHEAKRFEFLLPTLTTLLERGAKRITLIGHRGRPNGQKSDELSNKPLISYFEQKLGKAVAFAQEFSEAEALPSEVVLFENLRFWAGEEENSSEFAQQLAKLGDVYVNEAFGSSHRAHASIVSIPKLLPHAAGLRFAAEVEHLTKVLTNPARPLIFIISGAKEDKLEYVKHFSELADKVLVGGKLPMYLGGRDLGQKVVVARLLPDNEDITMHAIEHFEGEIKRAKTVVISGPLGKFEEDGHRQGTKRVFETIATTDCYSLAGGGDTEHALAELGLREKIDWVSTGGGAMLELLAKGTLPGIEALMQ